MESVSEVRTDRPEIRVLGHFEVGGDLPVPLPAGRVRSLCAVLAMSAGQLVSFDTITAAVWGDEPPGNTRSSVETLVSRLRRQLSRPIVRRPGGYLLEMGPDDVDALRFARLLDEARAARDTVIERERLAAALTLWRGTPFEGVRSDWLTRMHGDWLTERYLTAVERRIDLDVAAGRVNELVSEVREVAERHPLRESLWARLLVVLDRSGRPGEALACYESIRYRLADQLGVDPGPELRRLHADLLAGRAAGLAGGSRAPGVPRQLPADVPEFTGREPMLSRLDELTSGRLPVVITALHGCGGVGKTALAVHWAHRVRDRFPDGQLYVNLRGYGPGQPMDAPGALHTLLSGLGVSADRIPSGTDERAVLLRSMLAERRALVVLDNARDSGQLRHLLPDAGSSLMLITSRNQLRDVTTPHGLHRIVVDAMRPDESTALLAACLGRQRISYDAESLRELAELCGHLPLALLVAAERACRDADAELQDLLGALRQERDRLDALGSEDWEADLRSVFSWSYRALDRDTARLFRRLGLNPGPDIGVPTAAALSGTTPRQAAALLDRLADSHLIERSGPDRYEQHDLLRSYANELCMEMDSAAERDAALSRVYDWYVHSSANAKRVIGLPVLLSDIGSPLPGTEAATFADGTEALAWFDRERPTVIALVRDAAGHDHHREAYLITHLLTPYFSHRYLLDEVFALQHIAMEAAEQSGDLAAIATCANHLGLMYARFGDHQPAIDHLERALELFGAVGNDLGRSSALRNLGLALQQAGRPAEAVTRLRQSIDTTRALGDIDGEASSLNNLGMAYVDLGRYDEAVAVSSRAIGIHRERGHLLSEPNALDTLAQALTGLGRYTDAIAEYRRAIEIFSRIDDRWNECITYTHLGITQRTAGHVDDARTSWSRALHLYDQLGATDNNELRRSDLVNLIQTLPTTE